MPLLFGQKQGPADKKTWHQLKAVSTSDCVHVSPVPLDKLAQL